MKVTLKIQLTRPPNPHAPPAYTAAPQSPLRRPHHRDAQKEQRRPGPRSLDDEVVDLITSEKVRAAVQQLPEDERAAIELAYFGGRSYREVATELDVPEGTVKSRIRSGMGRLRDSLATVGATEEAETNG